MREDAAIKCEMDSKDADILLTGACEYYFMQQILHVCDYVKELEWGDYCGLSGWALNANINFLARRKSHTEEEAM